MKNVFKALLLAVIVVVYPVGAFAGNVHIVDEDPSTGYRVVRMGKSSEAVLDEMCQYGKGKIRAIILSGDGSHEENYARSRCPGLEVVYNIQQRTKTPLTKGFLEFFDQEVARAKAEGTQIMFRCKCGCHRTGRLAAYYNIKYKKMAVAAALKDLGKNMTFGAKLIFRKTLRKQVPALKAWMENGRCPYKKKKAKKWCVQNKSSLV